LADFRKNVSSASTISVTAAAFVVFGTFWKRCRRRNAVVKSMRARLAAFLRLTPSTRVLAQSTAD